MQWQHRVSSKHNNRIDDVYTNKYESSRTCFCDDVLHILALFKYHIVGLGVLPARFVGSAGAGLGEARQRGDERFIARRPYSRATPSQ